MDDVRLKINKVRRVVDVYRCIYLHGVRYAVNADIPRGQEVVLTLLDGKVVTTYQNEVITTTPEIDPCQGCPF